MWGVLTGEAERGDASEAMWMRSGGKLVKRRKRVSEMEISEKMRVMHGKIKSRIRSVVGHSLCILALGVNIFFDIHSFSV